MDTLTHMALGATIGQAIGHQKFGGKALIFGALAGLAPDLDVFATPFLGEFGSWKYHRAFTHSIWFVALFGSLSGWLLWRHYGRQAKHLYAWIFTMLLATLAHPLLDFCTIYGTQLLAPFSNHRFEISAISIIDPVYTLILFASILTIYSKRLRVHARSIATATIILTTSYIGFGYYLNHRAEDIAIAQLQEQKISYKDVKAYTTIFQPFMRRIVVRDDDMIRVGFVSTYAPKHIFWGCRKQESQIVRNAIINTNEGQIFNWFSSENLNISKGNTNNQVNVTDIRYGVPGDSLFGWWGQSYIVSNNQDRITATYNGKTRAERDASMDAIKNLFLAAYGFDNNFLMTTDIDCPK